MLDFPLKNYDSWPYEDEDEYEDDGDCEVIDLSAPRESASEEVYYQLDCSCSDFMRWTKVTAAEAFASHEEIVIAETQKEAYDQILAQMPATKRPELTWHTSSSANKIIVYPIEILQREFESLDHLYAVIKELGTANVHSLYFTIGGESVEISDKKFARSGFLVDDTYKPGCYRHFTITWDPERLKKQKEELEAEKRAEELVNPIGTVIEEMKRELPKTAVFKKCRSERDQLLFLDAYIALFNAVNGANSHRYLKKFQALLALWPGLKAEKKQLFESQRKTVGIMAWLDDEHAFAAENPIPEDQLVEINKNRTIAAYCNPDFGKKAKTTARSKGAAKVKK